MKRWPLLAIPVVALSALSWEATGTASAPYSCNEHDAPLKVSLLFDCGVFLATEWCTDPKAGVGGYFIVGAYRPQR